MSDKKIYVIRHGETEFNRLGIVQGSGVDSDLNDVGRDQAYKFYKNYNNINFQLVVTSTLKRTHQTVHRFIDDSIPWIQNQHINEICWGDHEGKIPNAERSAEFNTMLDAWQRSEYDASLPNGESANQLSHRVALFIDWVKARPEDHILVATHGRTMRALITTMKGLSPSSMDGTPHSNTGLYLIRQHQGNFTFELENNTDHLSSE